MVCCLDEPKGLGCVRRRLGESAELGETRKPVSVVSEIGMWVRKIPAPIGRQRCEIIGGQLDDPLVLATEEVPLPEIGRGQDPDFQVPEALGDFQARLPVRAPRPVRQVGVCS